MLVHGLKSASRTIGALDLSRVAERMEAAADRGCAAVIDREHGEMLRQYGATAAAIRDLLGSAPARSNLEEIAASLEECNDATNGMWMGREAFGNVYRHMLRYLERYHGVAFQVLFTVEMPKDTYTNGHSGRVAKYSREIAKRYGYSRKRQDEIYMMGLLHDVGKIGVPDAVINKPSRLTDEEYAQIKTHIMLQMMAKDPEYDMSEK